MNWHSLGKSAFSFLFSRCSRSVCVCARVFFSFYLAFALALASISALHCHFQFPYKSNPRIDWVNRFLAVATKCIYFTVFYNIRMPYNEHFAQSSEKVLCSCGRIRERKRNKSRTNEQKASIYTYVYARLD